MDKLKNIPVFFNELRLSLGAVWVENGKLMLSSSKEFQNPETNEFIIKNKSQIIKILEENGIFSVKTFLNLKIFKDKTSLSYPLSFAQERLWFIEQYEQGTNAYHIPAVFELDIDTDKEAIKYALQQIASRHEILRSTIEHDIQNVHDAALSIEEIDVLDTDDYDSLIRHEINRPFDLGTQYPIRVGFYTIKPTLIPAPDKILLCITTHHIASDGWSMNIFQDELWCYYQAYKSGDTTFRLPDLEIQYKDYAAWQRTFLTGTALENQLSYWKGKLAGYQTLELPADHIRPTEIDYRGSSHDFILDKKISSKLRDLAQQYGLTLNSVMLGSMNILLGKYTGQDDIVIGSAIANRHHRQTEGLIGFFVNTQANRTFLNATQTFAELIQQVHQDQIEAQMHQDLPFEKLIDELGVERDASRHPVFQVMFGVQNFEVSDKATDHQKSYLKHYLVEDVYEVEKFDLSVFIDDSQEELSGHISYATSLFDADTIAGLSNHYIHLLDQLTQSPNTPYSEMGLLDAAEYQKIVYDWNATTRFYAEEKTLQEMFVHQAQATPFAVALVYENQELTYSDLNEKSNQLAREIREQYQRKTGESLKSDTLIALYLERSLEMVIAILAVLKSGGAYVPIDPGYPQDRIDYILEDTQAELILIQRGLETENQKLPQDKLLCIYLAQDLYELQDKENLPQYSQSTDLAYVIYTSGTTGKPKGVMLNHSGIINRIEWMQDMYPLNADDVVFQKTPYVFDVSVWELLWANWYGAKIVFAKPEGHKDSEYLHQTIKKHKVTTLHFVPSMLEGYNHYLDSIKDKFSATIKYMFCSGEALSNNTVQHTYKNSNEGAFKLHNLYGPTEASIDVTFYETDPIENVYIGKPIQNTQVYILSSTLTPVPVGITGELYIGGAGLAKGYLNRSDLTRERFVPNPFATASDVEKGYTRLYKTGDLVRWLADGNIEYLGRNDDQVKIRGYRIELGEIEAALGAIDGIKQVCVLARERETQTGITKILAGYYVAAAGEVLPETLLLEKLAAVLPDYMVPAILIRLDSFPLTINGKLDKRALPDPDFNSAEAQYVKPETNLEISLCGIYAEVLGLQSDQISTHQNFFKMGGNSILSLQLKQKLNKLHEFAHISIADLFEYNSIQKLIQNSRAEHLPEYKLQEKLGTATDQIAIIGTSGSFSGVSNTQEFWDLIASQQEGLTFNSREECLLRGVEESVLDLPHYIGVSSDIKDMDQFDPFFWDISPNEARQLSPQIRKFIENSWFVLESSGYSHQRKSHTIGVFAGSGTSDYFQDHVLNGEMADQINMWEASASNSKDALATKTAFFLGLSGPAISINTGCSTGLVSVIEACKNLQLGFCNMALAGGVSLDLPDEVGYVYQEGMILSKDGHCRTFDQQASGTTAGSGVGVVLLKRLSDAVKDGDPILGIIKGYATNNDGDRKTGYTAPSIMGQSECIINAQRMAGISSNEIDYVECHGTATHLGDPIEVQALREAFAFNKDKEKTTDSKTVLGAVKANIGHSDSAAGVASLIKVVLMLENNTIPGQVNYDSPNEELQLEQTNFEILKQNRHWPAHGDKQRLAGISSFGVGGTNAHVIIGDYKADQEDQQENPIKGEDESANYIIPISAKSRKSLELNKVALIDYLKTSHTDANPLSIRNLSYSLQEKREQFNFRSAYCARTINELVLKLESDSLYSEIDAASHNKTVFMFPGQGAQYCNMAKTLYDNDAFFKTTLDHCIALANTCLEVDLAEVLFSETLGLYDINETQWTQVTLFIVEYSLSQYLDNLGVKADAFIGHSIGEYVAAVLCGIFSLEDAIKIVISRGQLMQSMPLGSMLAIHANEDRVVDIVQENHCEIAVINSLEDVVVSGSDQAIDSLKKALDIEGIASIKLKTSHAYHSSMMDQVLPEFEKVFNDIRFNMPSGLFVSNVTGEFAGSEVLSSAYWCQQLRGTVEFAKGINSLSLKYNHQVNFIEVGPGKGLCSFVSKYKNLHHYKSIQTTALLPSEKESREQPFGLNREEFRARLWMSGVLEKPNSLESLTHSKLQGGLPSYQFDFQKCWIEKKKVTKSEDQLTLLPKEKWLSTPVWISAFNLEKDTESNKKGFKNALIFIREDQINSFDFNILTQNSQIIVLDLNCDSTSITVDENVFRLNPANEEHFLKLTEYINVIDIVFETIIHASSVDNLSDNEHSLYFGFYSLSLIQKYLLNTVERENILVLTNGIAQITNEDIINSFNGALAGTVRSINNEFPDIDAKIIDIGYGQQTFNSINQLIKSDSYKKSDELLAIKFGKLWIERFEKVNDFKSSEETITDGDVILLTGNLKSFALPAAKYMAGKHQLKFVLVSPDTIYDNSILSPYAIERFEIIESIKKAGSSFYFHRANLSSLNEVSTLVKEIESIHGNIKGIIHTEEAALENSDHKLDNTKIVLKELVYGLDHLINLIDLKHLKFIALKSSLSSIPGETNSIEFCACNSYLDYLPTDKNRFKNIRVVSVNFPWIYDSYTGKNGLNDDRKNQNSLQDFDKLMYLNSFEENEAAELFYNSINQAKYQHLAISKVDIIKLKNKLLSNSTNKFTKKPVTIFEENYSETESKIAEIFAGILGLEQISIHDDFFKIGGNSILAIHVSHQVTELFNVDVTVADLFKCKSASGLKGVLLEYNDKENIKREIWTI